MEKACAVQLKYDHSSRYWPAKGLLPKRLLFNCMLETQIQLLWRCGVLWTKSNATGVYKLWRSRATLWPALGKSACHYWSCGTTIIQIHCCRAWFSRALVLPWTILLIVGFILLHCNAYSWWSHSDKIIAEKIPSKCAPSAMSSGVWGRVAKIKSRRSSLNSELAWKITQKLVEYKDVISNDICVKMHFVYMSWLTWKKNCNEKVLIWHKNEDHVKC